MKWKIQNIQKYGNTSEISVEPQICLILSQDTQFEVRAPQIQFWDALKDDQFFEQKIWQHFRNFCRSANMPYFEPGTETFVKTAEILFRDDPQTDELFSQNWQHFRNFCSKLKAPHFPDRNRIWKSNT